MKKILLFMAFIAVNHNLSAQVTTNLNGASGALWQDAVLRADGLVSVGGVEAYSMRITCNNEDFILIKFINKNNYKVRAEWTNAIKINGEWIYSKNQTPKTLTLEPNNNVAGQCDGTEKLKVKVNSIIDNPKDFGYYSVSGLATFK